jgi:hypothetical protein
MPRIRDLGISVIPATMRPPEIGDGAGHQGNVTCNPTDPQCKPTHVGDCNPTDGQCNPTPPQCHATPKDDDDQQCCPTDAPHSAKDGDGSDLAPESKLELKQQLRDQLDAQP